MKAQENTMDIDELSKDLKRNMYMTGSNIE